MLAGRQRHHEEYRTAGECHQGWATRPTMHRSVLLGLKPCVGICAAARVGSGGNQGLVVAVNHAYSVAADIVQPHPVLGGVLGGPGPVVVLKVCDRFVVAAAIGLPVAGPLVNPLRAAAVVVRAVEVGDD